MNLPLVHPGNLLCNAKPQPEMAFVVVRLIHSVKTLENAVFLVVRDTRAVIGYPDFGFSPLLAKL